MISLLTPDAPRLSALSRPPARSVEDAVARRDGHPGVAGTPSFLEDVLGGLSQERRTLPCKYLYDARGSELFDAICDLPEYYPTRTETAILSERLDEIAGRLPPGAVLVEYGSGSSSKTRRLLDRLADLAAYVPIDISRSHLLRSAWRLKAAYPRLDVRPVCADFTKTFRLPRLGGRPRTLFFPGSTIGNFVPDEAAALLGRMAAVAGPGGGLLIGVDLRKPAAILEPAYDDAAGVTAAFNLNLLVRINRDLDGTFDLDGFAHRAVFDAADSRVEMHLVSRGDQTVTVAGRPFDFRRGETIHTENSHKYGRDDFAALARRGGWNVDAVWTDPADLFSVQYLTTA